MEGEMSEENKLKTDKENLASEDAENAENAKENSEECLEEASEEKLEDEKADETDENEKENEVKETDDFETKYLRLAADFQNFKKRTEKEKSDIFKSANARLITELLPLIDDFDRAIEHSEESSKESFADGIEMIIKRFAEILCKEGLEYIDVKDAMFDPNLHHAVMMEEVEGEESGKILQELQKGYKVNGKVIRPSMVKVSE